MSHIKSHFKVQALSLPLGLYGSRPTIGSHSPFVSWAWLSPDELHIGISKLGLQNVKVYSNNTALSSSVMPGRNKAHIVLAGKHYIVLLERHGQTYFFDPLGNQPAQYMMLPQTVVNLSLHVQPRSSAYCGNYCLFFLHVYKHCVAPLSTTQGNIRSVFHQSMSRYLHMPPESLANNDFLIENFTTDFEIGEEFVSSKYSKFEAYRKEVSRRALGMQ
ncbi:TPA_asm: LO8 [Leatherback sea turtle adomavirus]|nr:TPA_asm: LO8 [Leatherback sea turtle adomavirus]